MLQSVLVMLQSVLVMSHVTVSISNVTCCSYIPAQEYVQLMTSQSGLVMTHFTSLFQGSNMLTGCTAGHLDCHYQSRLCSHQVTTQAGLVMRHVL